MINDQPKDNLPDDLPRRGQARARPAGTAAVRPRRRWYQYSLRTLLVVVTLAAVFLGLWVVPRIRRHAVVVRLEQLGGNIEYIDNPADESWLVHFLSEYLPRDWLDEVRSIIVMHSEVRDGDLAGIGSFTQLQELNLGITQVTGAGLEQLKGLTQLQGLYLGYTQFTDAGLEHLKGLMQLEELLIDGTQITDAGLEHLKGLRHLQVLILGNTQITDAGLDHLHGLTQLQRLDLTRTRVTENGVAQLQKSLPDCWIRVR